MNSFKQTWNSLEKQAKWGIIIGTILIILSVIGIGLWSYRADYQVLFSDVAARDAAAMTAELDKMKTPYKLADGGQTILVPQELVYKTRLSLMSKDLPLHGAVGFEVFNNADFGMTEFVQKVNFLRAIQGELTRTILSIEDIQNARVHLAIPEQGLFKKAVTKPKASVTLGMKPGRVLAPAQIVGIQRLVAASVPDITPNDVTVLDQQGIALTKNHTNEAANELGGGGQLEVKRSTEDYLAKKLNQVLDSTFGAGQTVASIDVVLNLDQSKITTEEILPAKGGASDATPSGVVIRERQAIRDGNNASGTSGKNSSGMTTTESDYQVGRRIEHLAVASGTVKRMTVAVLVRQPLNESQVEKLKEIVTMTLGFNSSRGDAVVLYSMDKFINNAAAAIPQPHANTPSMPNVAKQAKQEDNFQNVMMFGIAAATLLLLTFLFFQFQNRQRPRLAQMSDAERAQLLQDVRQWIASANQRSDAGEGK